MNTKTSYKCVHNFYDGGNHGPGRDSPGALLDMLAEVASQTLHSESIHTEMDMVMTKTKQTIDPVKRKTPQVYLNLEQILSMPLTQLVKHFAVFTSDELKRQYSYVCALIPDCQQKYTSFASEGKARISITAHLSDHLDYLKNNEDSYRTFKATTVKYTKPKSSVTSKKHKGQQSKKPQETLNKENKLVKPEKSTSYLRKILCNEMNFKEFENRKKLDEQNGEGENMKCETVIKMNESETDVDSKVLVDHCYYEHTKGGTIANDAQQEVVINEGISENIMLMVVANDDVHMKELPFISDDMAGQSNPECNPEYIANTKSWTEEQPEEMSAQLPSSTAAEIAESAAASVPGKPKGKAKFIGTSKEEREMALVLIERIKKKGNPTGSNLQCRICDPPRSFTASTTLVSHYRSHAGIKPYECRICRAVFTRRHSLKYHMLIHQNQTRFTCADCGKKFRHPSHFREHRRRHTGESPFGCEDCGQRFKTRNTYKRHLKTRHGKVLTTTGELLCLTEEEFQKVQTNRKRKSQSVSLDCKIEVDAGAIEEIVEYENGIDDNYENNNDEMEDMKNYHVLQVNEMSTALRVNENFSNVVDIEKTEIIETEIDLNNTGFVNHNKHESNDSSVLYENGIVDEEQTEFHYSPIEIMHRLADNEKNQRTDTENNFVNANDYVSVVVEYNENPPSVDENELIVPYNCNESVDYPENVEKNCEQETMEHTDEVKQETRLNVNYAYKIQGNVQYQLHVIPQETVRIFDNSQDYEEQRNIECNNNNNNNNNNNETEENADISDVTESGERENDSSSTTMSSQFNEKGQTLNIVSPVNNSTFLVLSSDNYDLNGHLRIDSNNIVLKEIAPISSIAVPQK